MFRPAEKLNPSQILRKLSTPPPRPCLALPMLFVFRADPGEASLQSPAIDELWFVLPPDRLGGLGLNNQKLTSSEMAKYGTPASAQLI